MKIKAAYYLKRFPTKIAIQTTDGSIKLADLTPFRIIREDELTPALEYDISSTWKNTAKDPIPDYILRLYGLEVEQG